MFTGIIETIGTVTAVDRSGSNINFRVKSAFTQELKIDQSVAHNGVCLTVVEISGDEYTVTAVDETLQKTNLGDWRPGSLVNLERALLAGARLDGHFVQGHVDTTGTCEEVTVLDGSHLYRFRFPKQFAGLVIEKGSICINGVSLTLFNITDTEFSVTIIPYTYEHTSFKTLRAGDRVNLEFDILGKYLLRNLQISRAGQPA